MCSSTFSGVVLEKNLCRLHYLPIKRVWRQSMHTFSDCSSGVYMDVVYAYMNQGLFLSKVATRKMCTDNLYFEKVCFGYLFYTIH